MPARSGRSRPRNAAVQFVLFYHSLVSDWNHGNAHFLRGIVRELRARGHEVALYEPADGWSRSNLLADHGERAIAEFEAAFPGVRSTTYDLPSLDLDRALEAADVVIVHEWNAPELVARIGRHRAAGGAYRLLFHDTHHRSVSAPHLMQAFELDAFDGILAFGEVVRELYLRRGWARRAWTWHEAADVRLCRPIETERREGDLVWVGNWGDGERTVELEDYLLEPARRLQLAARVYGVRYPEHALRALAVAGISYGGWLPNHRVPEVFARFAVTVHVPRRPYVRALPGIPTIRVFEALACGIPLVSAPWDDVEGLFGPDDMLFAADAEQMVRYLCAVLADRDLAQTLAQNGLATIRARHTCGDRVDQLLGICAELGVAGARLPEVA
jgi:spore maturation protein CgeB